MRNNIYRSDLNVLIQLMGNAVPTDIQVWDPLEVIYPDQSWHKTTVSQTPFKVLMVVGEFPSFLAPTAFDLVFHFGKIASSMEEEGAALKYVMDPQGFIRYVLPKANTKATYTKFYSADSWRSKAIKWALEWSSKCRLDHLVFTKELQVYSHQPLRYTQLQSMEDNDNFALYLGTQGAHRTALMATELSNGRTQYQKISLTSQGAKSVANEQRALRKLAFLNISNLYVPQLISSTFPDVLTTQDLGKVSQKRTHRFTEVHASVLEEIHNKTLQGHRFNQSSFWLTLQNQLTQISAMPVQSRLHQQVTAMVNELDVSGLLYTTGAHGDFTPWNMWLTEQGLYVYDWELSKSQCPILFDFFHYHFQHDVLVKHRDAVKIGRHVDQLMHHPFVQKVKETLQVNIRVYFQLYLIQSAIKHLLEFNNQHNLNKQNAALRQSLADLLECQLLYPSKDQRVAFIDAFDAQLRKGPHAYLKLLTPNILDLPVTSDLDIAVKKKQVPSLIQFARNHRFVKKTSVVKKSFMTILNVHFKNGAYLSIDLIYQFKRKRHQFGQLNALIQQAVPNTFGYCVPQRAHDWEYAAMFYLLNHASIPPKYVAYYVNPKTPSGHAIIHGFKLRYGLTQFSQHEIVHADSKVVNHLKRAVRQQDDNQWGNALRNSINYFRDVLNDIHHHRGIVVTLSGVDGAGKSTVIQQVKKRLENKYRKQVVLLRHRPGLFPILSAWKYGRQHAEERASVTLPRMGENSSVWSSALRFGYYFMDYLVGQVYVYFKYTLRGTIVLYDRYYFDFMYDAKRSNIELNHGLIAWLYRFIVHPELNIFLYASPDVILRRKQEMSAHQIITISQKYRSFFDAQRAKQGAAFTSIRNKDLEHTVNTVFEAYLSVA